MALRDVPPESEFPVMPTAGAEDLGRRDFLKMSGFALSATALTGCVRGKERGVVPYLVAREEVVPGRAYWYASVCGACPAQCGILAKALDGRPVKLEGNPGHPLSAGGLCAIGQASLLGLYDSQRLREPLVGGDQSTWDEVDSAVAESLDRLAESGRAVRFLTDSTTGPAERSEIERFLSRFADARLMTYDPLSQSAIADAHAETHGRRATPTYRLERAEVIVSFGADFLGSWISPVEHAKAYRAGRSLSEAGAPFSHHVQLESRLTLTGSNADRRVVIPPGSTATILAHVTDRVARTAGISVPWKALPRAPVSADLIAEIARLLSAAKRSRALVLCGDNDLGSQKLVNFINHALGGYDRLGTVDLRRPSQQRVGADRDLLDLRRELATGTVAALFVRNVNPVYELPFGGELASSLAAVELVVSFSERVDETAEHAHFVCPEPHFLESWGDSEPAAGLVALRQPVLRVVGHTRPMLESLSTWSGQPEAARDSVRRVWRQQVHSRAKEAPDFEEFWNKTLHDGWASVGVETSEGEEAFAASAIALPEENGVPSGALIAEAHPSTGVFDGRHAHNPWLLELPDPVSKTTWDNAITLAVATASSIGVSDGDEVELTLESGARIVGPALVQPGQHPDSVAVALGWGRKGTERFAEVGPQWWEGKPTVDEGALVGFSAASLISFGSHLAYSGQPVTLRATGGKRTLASTQRHHSLFVPARLAIPGHERRPIVRETTLADLEHETHGDSGHGESSSEGHGAHPSLYEDHEKKGHHWGLAIDLSACNGCSACVVSCQAENNVPVVGRDEVSRSREMHWMRIDRYYSGDGEDVDVVHMPMLCQHCDLAPCENVCPVQATVQSAEGLNQQVYNRCVGTRYCANNCPYKVRRFNWFDYPREDRLQNMALNPDVTIRSRGVMEKCSLCVQRIQEAKSEAKAKGVELADGDIDVACAQSCPADAIVFGDMNDPESRLAKLKEDPRHYTVLAELGVRPVVGYLSKVRNRTERSGSDEHV
jgi:molybdopterin-containing oxidoreductase family iron-sulfur binding subunit